MKQWWLVAAVCVAVAGAATVAVPAQKAREFPVALSAAVVGNVIVFTAVSPAYAPTYRDEWSGPEPVGTRRVAGRYVATAELAPIYSGRYGVIYRIWQSAGKTGHYNREGRAWAWFDVTVADDGTVTIN